MTLRPWMKSALRAPVRLYDAGLGWVFGHRFLVLTHRGRRSGRTYRTMVEVVEWRPGPREAIVMSGFGRKSSWYLNVDAGGAEKVEIGREAFPARVRELGLEEASEALAGYEGRNRLLTPVVRTVLSRLAGFDYDGSESSRRRLLAELPLLGLAPVDPPHSGAGTP